MTVTLHETLIGSSGPSKPFSMTGRTAAPGETFTLPISNGRNAQYHCVIDWGDGTPPQTANGATAAQYTHTYATPGDHVIQITGKLKGFAFKAAGAAMAAKVVSINSWGILEFADNDSEQFRDCKIMTITATDLPHLGPSCASMFRDCAALTGVPRIGEWDTSRVTDFSQMFRDCVKFNDPIGTWNTSKAWGFWSMFWGCHEFNQPLTNWNVANTNNLSNMFFDCYKFNQPLNHFVSAKLTNISGMFHNCQNFNQPLSNWDVSKVTTLEGVFFNCYVFNQDLSMWRVTNAATVTRGMFDNARVFNSNLNNWDVSNVTDMGRMFSSTFAFNSPLDKWNTGNCIDMHDMFLTAKVFNQNVSMWNVSKVKNFNLMFSKTEAFNCGLPANIVHTLMNRTLTAGWRTGSADSMNDMFNNAKAWAGNVSSWCTKPTTTHVGFDSAPMGPGHVPAHNPVWGTCPIPN